MKLRKILAAVMACSIVCGAPAAIRAYQPSYELTVNAADIVDSGKCGDNVTWQLDSEGTLTISGEGDMWDNSDSYYVPWRQYREKINKIVIDEQVTRIGDYAFDCCENASIVKLPDGLKSIGENSFGSSGIEEIVIPNGVAEIPKEAFTACHKLKSVTIPNSVTSIGYSAFELCDNLESLTIPNSVTNIDSFAFRWCTKLKSVTIPNSITNIGDDGVFSWCSSLKTVTIPNSVTSIGSQVFVYCSNLESIIIPDSVASIGYVAFAYCDGLKSITILNPECEIYDTASTICSTFVNDSSGSFEGVIIGYKGSTAEAYANKWGYKFEALAEETTTTTTTTTTAKPTTTTTTTTSTTTTTTTSTTAQETTTTTTTATTAPVSTTSADTRFVGTWTETEPKLSVTDAPMVFCFNADGTGSYRWKNDTSGFYVNVLWRAEDDILYMDEQVEDGGTVTYKYSFKDGALIFTTTGESAVTSELRKEESVSLGDPTGDGKVDSKDASFVLVEYAKLSTGGESSLTEAEKSAADVNKDGKNDSKDASIILSYYAYISTSGTDSLEEFLKNQ